MSTITALKNALKPRPGINDTRIGGIEKDAQDFWRERRADRYRMVAKRLKTQRSSASFFGLKTSNANAPIKTKWPRTLKSYLFFKLSFARAQLVHGARPGFRQCATLGQRPRRVYTWVCARIGHADPGHFRRFDSYLAADQKLELPGHPFKLAISNDGQWVFAALLPNRLAKLPESE